MADRQIDAARISATGSEAGRPEETAKPHKPVFLRLRIANRGRRVLAIATVFLAVSMILFLSLRPAHQSGANDALPTGLAVGQPAPDFTLRDLRNLPIHLRALRGHVVLLNFWATYCPPCRHEMPDLERAARHFVQSAAHERGSKPPVILGIDAGAEDRTTVARYARQVGVTYPLLLDPVFQVGLVTYHVFSIPFTLIVDADGIIRQAHLGPLTYAEIVHLIQEAE